MQGQAKGSAIFFCIFCFIAVVAIPFIVCDLYYAYNDPSFCLNQPITKYSISFTLKTWLLVSGYITIGIVGLFLLTAIVSCFSVISAGGLLIFNIVLLIFNSLFNLAWLIVGALIFWGEVMPNCGSSLSSYMWAVLIINFVGMFCNIFSSQRFGSQGSSGQAFSGFQLNRT